MTDEPFQVGQRVELIGDTWEGCEATIWEIGDEHIGFIYDHDAHKSEVTPQYVAVVEASSCLRPLRPKRHAQFSMPRERFPSCSELVFHTTDNQSRAGFDSRDIIASLGPKGPMLDVACTRYTGILPARRHQELDPDQGWDGTWSFSRRLTPDEWRRIETEFASIDFWSLWFDDAVRPEPHEEYELWSLLVDHLGEQHQVDRCRRPNEIESFCRLLYDLAGQPGLLRGDSSKST